MSEQDYMPNWCRVVMRWTSPIWYLYLMFVAMLIVVAFSYYAMTNK